MDRELWIINGRRSTKEPRSAPPHINLASLVVVFYHYRLGFGGCSNTLSSVAIHFKVFYEQFSSQPSLRSWCGALSPSRRCSLSDPGLDQTEYLPLFRPVAPVLLLSFSHLIVSRDYRFKTWPAVSAAARTQSSVECSFFFAAVGIQFGMLGCLERGVCVMRPSVQISRSI